MKSNAASHIRIFICESLENSAFPLAPASPLRTRYPVFSPLKLPGCVSPPSPTRVLWIRTITRKKLTTCSEGFQKFRRSSGRWSSGLIFDPYNRKLPALKLPRFPAQSLLPSQFYLLCRSSQSLHSEFLIKFFCTYGRTKTLPYLRDVAHRRCSGEPSARTRLRS